MINPGTILAGVFFTGAVFGLGFHVRGEFEEGACANRLIGEMKTASDVLDRKVGELDQCRGQVDKINQSMDEQGRRLQEEIRKNRLADAEAAAEARKRDIRYEESRRATAEALSALRSAIDDKDFGACAGEPVNDQLIGLLNDALAASQGGDGSGRDGDLSSPDSQD